MTTALVTGEMTGLSKGNTLSCWRLPPTKKKCLEQRKILEC